MADYTIRNPHETLPLTEATARGLGFRTARDSSGLLASIYELDDETEAADIRGKGFVVERVRPTLYLSNWSSHRTRGMHGPGRKLTIMARPRRWEHGDGSVPALVPVADNVVAVKGGDLSPEKYFAIYEGVLTGIAPELGPGRLSALDSHVSTVPVVNGDTLCCACAKGAPCHRRAAAPFLARAGWRVILDGVEVGAS